MNVALDPIAEDTVRRSFDAARRATTSLRTGIDIDALDFQYPQLAEVIRVYHRGVNATTDYDYTLARQPNPLQVHLDNLERRHR